MPLDQLLAHWLGELDEAEDARVGEHLMGCGDCNDKALWVAQLSASMPALVREGQFQATVSPEFVQRAIEAGLRTREYCLSPGGSVNCTIAPEDDLLITRLEVTLPGSERVDLLMLDEQGNAFQRFADIPYDPAAKEVLLASRVADIKAMPETRFSMRLVVPAASGERTIGNYSFHHRPWPGH